MCKYSAEEKIQICKDYLCGKSSASELCAAHGLSRGKPPGTFWRWISQYQQAGPAAFVKTSGNRSYSKDLKEKAVKEYLAGKGSLLEICGKYNISSERTLSDWIKCYNANIELKDYEPKREVYMAEARRKTTLEERKEIVDYCISHNNDYKGTASRYEVSYSQVYSWVKKYREEGEEGLEDRRGHHKSDNALDEVERLRRENKRLKKQLEERDMLCELLKKGENWKGCEAWKGKIRG